VTPGAVQLTFGGQSDGFVCKLDTAGGISSSTIIGGNGVDAIYGLVVTPSDTSVIACGDTYSSNLPSSQGAYQSAFAGSGDGFMVRFEMSEDIMMMSTLPAVSPVLLTVFPNPSVDEMWVSTGEIISTYSLYDINGRLVRCGTVNAFSVVIGTGDLPAGMYQLCVEADGKVQTARVVKR
jgi:hypothetical protein